MYLRFNKFRRNFRSIEIEIPPKNASRRFATKTQAGRKGRYLQWFMR